MPAQVVERGVATAKLAWPPPLIVLSGIVGGGLGAMLGSRPSYLMDMYATHLGRIVTGMETVPLLSPSQQLGVIFKLGLGHTSLGWPLILPLAAIIGILAVSWTGGRAWRPWAGLVGVYFLVVLVDNRVWNTVSRLAQGTSDFNLGGVSILYVSAFLQSVLVVGGAWLGAVGMRQWIERFVPGGRR